MVSVGAFYSVGVCGALAGDVEQLQVTLGEGPSLDAVGLSAPVLVADLNNPDTRRWSVFVGAAARLGGAGGVRVAGEWPGSRWEC
jgi:hypothetical protein